MKIHIGIDAGGTSTRCIAVAANGECVGYGVAASGNPISAGPALAAASVADAVADALRQAGASGDRVTIVVLAMAGASARGSLHVFAEALAPLGVSAPNVFAPDLLATFCSGTWRPAGYALVAGTGSAAVRVEDGEVAATADGLGWLLGDEGSGFWIGRRVVRAAVAELDRRGPSTALTPLLLAALGLDLAGTVRRGRPAVLDRLIDQLYALRPVELSRFAPLAFEAADDPTAAAIVQGAADALTRTLDAVADPAVTGPIVLGGGTLAGRPELASRIGSSRLSADRTEICTVADGTVGAAVLALRRASVTVDERVFARIEATLAALRST